MGYRSEHLPSRRIVFRGRNYMAVEHLFRVASEKPAEAVYKADPPLPTEAGSLLVHLNLDWKDDAGTANTGTRHDVSVYSRANALTCVLRDIKADWYRNSRVDSAVSLFYESGPDVGEGTEILPPVIWETDVGVEADNVLFTHRYGDPPDVITEVPDGGMTALVPITTIVAKLKGGHLTPQMLREVGSLNDKTFRQFQPLDVKYLGVTSSVITGEDVIRGATRSDIVLTFLAKQQWLGFEQRPGWSTPKPINDADGNFTGDFDYYEDPANRYNFGLLFAGSGFDPGPFV